MKFKDSSGEPTEIQKIDLQILKKLLNIFDKYDLEYFMLGGTMLGSIRHKGFIPWDDDIDLGMPRKDYEKFLKVAVLELNDNLKIVDYRYEDNYPYYLTRVVDIDHKVIELRFNKIKFAAIDLFPLDGMPNKKLKRKLHIIRILFHRALMSIAFKRTIQIDSDRGKIEKIFLKIIKHIPIDKFINAQNQKLIIDKLLKKYSMIDSKFSGNIMGAYRDKEIIPTSFYGNKYFEFEGIQLRGIEHYDKYLTHLYGDYMQLPKKENRKVHYRLVDQ